MVDWAGKFVRSFRRKSFQEPGMAFKKADSPSVAELQNLLEGVAKNIVDRVYGPQGPAWGTQFSDLEEMAVQVGQKVSQRIIDQALQRQATEPVLAEDQVCPKCQHPLIAGDPEPRIVATRVGDAQWKEPSASCRRCRRDFFPSVEASGD
jgi:hypothetical protein